ncbi:unnamed protein product [Linum tenue]|uniref:DUF4283 domain-containing protein n=1 Tax=Linum tenue TaxID=586396 RepID=A0AAV0HF24_9ROSI|nr:unnamed protein product [Linum tenue]
MHCLLGSLPEPSAVKDLLQTRGDGQLNDGIVAEIAVHDKGNETAARKSQVFGSSGGGGVRREVCSRNVWIGSKLVSISREECGPRFWYRIRAKEGRRSWSVLLSELHLSWLQGVLQTSAMNGWRFGSGYVKRRGECVIHVGKAITRKGAFLQISESVKSGRVFKILIPSSGAGKGWAIMISLLQDFFQFERLHRDRFVLDSSCNKSGQAVPAQQSYADVVKGGGFYGAGRCMIRGSGGERFIEVNKDGVEERREFLGRSLVIRFHPTTDEVFSAESAHGFVIWAIKTWAIDANYGFESTNSGKWILTCPSIQQALRIKAFDQCRYKSFVMDISHWSEISLKHDVSSARWVMVSGIPVHLKSVNLIRSIGEFCGSLVEIDWNHWTSDVIRLGVRVVGELPERIPIRFGADCYWVKVSPVSELYTGESSDPSFRPRGDMNRPTSVSGSMQKGERCMGVVHYGARRPERGALVSVAQPAGVKSNSLNKSAMRHVWVRKHGPIWYGPRPPNPSGPDLSGLKSNLMVVHKATARGLSLTCPRWFYNFLSNIMMESPITYIVPCPSPFVWLFKVVLLKKSWISDFPVPHSMSIIFDPIGESSASISVNATGPFSSSSVPSPASSELPNPELSPQSLERVSPTLTGGSFPPPPNHR